ncbi:jasmonate O-methyltransferase-like [Asparagus officinalis]|uniref:jasmonate O-methyltransferase-like n=1 Tax=Asparagus officinalis TaxID=4686 RepID=UPI00098E598E|nr:jasmonate O-methyltransferase-like [Asparagus officinalis]
MDIHQVLRMNEGDGETSYANNSSPQRSLMLKTKPYIRKSIQEFFSSCNMKPKSLSVANLGCGTGPNSLVPVTIFLDVVHDCSQRFGCPCPELQVFLNDLPSNDFNTIFKNIPSFYKKIVEGKGDGFSGLCLVSAVPGSFYRRLFQSESLHFVYCANSLHWISQVPPLLSEMTDINKGNICYGKNSPYIVFEAYLLQFQRDLTHFLKSRSEEIIAGGCMVLELPGRKTLDPYTNECYYHFDDLALAMRDLVEEGIMEEEKMSSFWLPYYAPHIDEFKEVIRAEGSFRIIRCEEILWSTAANFYDKTLRKMIDPNFGARVKDLDWLET